MKRSIGMIAFVCYAALVAFLSLQPVSGAPPIGDYDKVAHLLAYAVFTLLAWGISRSPRDFIYISCAIVAYGALMEFGQSFVPGRDMSALDFLANTAGVIVGAALCLMLFAGRSRALNQ